MRGDEFAMKIKFPKKVRAALKRFSKVDREAYIQNAIAKQLAKDGRIAVPSDAKQKEPEPVSETSRVNTLTPVEGTVPFSYSCSSGSGSGFVGDEWPVSDAEQKETEPVNETPKPIPPVSAFDFGPSSGGSSRDHLPRYQDKGLEAMYREGIRNRDWIPPSEVIERQGD